MSDKSRFAEILIARGLMTKERVEQILSESREADKKLKICHDFVAPPPLTDEQMKRITEESRDCLKKAIDQAPERSTSPSKRTGECRFCGSAVVAWTSWQQAGPTVMGGHTPGHKVLHGYYCTNDDCGIMYKSCPPTRKKSSEP
jgi:hypothetical protein